jgi:hypothetical protein
VITLEPNMPARDIFLCHAHEDRFTHASPLVQELNILGISCWVDEGEILPGKSLIDAINDGLRTSTLVLVLVTERFLGPGWRRRELNAALAREIRTAATVVVPVLDVDHGRFAEQYPLLGDKLALDWAEGPVTIARKIAAMFPRSPGAEWHHDHPADHIGLVWVRVLPSRTHTGERHKLTLRWGPYFKEQAFDAPETGPVSFAHHKTAADAVTLHASVSPPAVVTFGQGPAPDQPALNIDEGWTRSSGGEWPGHL